jgi:hypothetical protein
LMRALDINGDNHLTKDEWLLFLFPEDVQELGDLDEERETLRKLKKRLLTVRWGERGGGGWCWGNGWWGGVVGVCGWLSPNVLFRIFFDCFDDVLCSSFVFQQSEEKIEEMQRQIKDQQERFQEVQMLPGMLQVIRDAQEKGLLRKSVVE